jgi:DNA-binding beta-propeller fold protein YncE
MRVRGALVVVALALGALLGNAAGASAQAIDPTVQDLSLPGSPFAVASTPDGHYVFASLSGDTNGIAIIRQDRASATLVRVLPTGAAAYGLTVSRDGRYLLDDVIPDGGATSPQGMQIIDIRRAVSGESGAILGTVPTGGADAGPGEVQLSPDGRFAFVSNEDNETVSVINFREALVTAGSPSSLVGNIPTDESPVGPVFSPDGRYLYITSEAANPTDPGYNPTACNTPTGIGTGTTPGPEGTLIVASVRAAETDPAKSVVATTYAGCSPVRVVTSGDGQVAWVTARAEDDVLAFSTRQLSTDSSHALLSRTPVGVAPVGLQLFDHDRLIAVADSNRFTTGQAGSVSILDAHRALDGAGSSATVGTFVAGDFPRQWGLSNDGQFLYLTEYSSNILAILPVASLVRDVSRFDPQLGSGFPFGSPW